ncbi:MAG: hypothetical protein QXN05_00375 [Acidilobaceae archaeon]
MAEDCIKKFFRLEDPGQKIAKGALVIEERKEPATLEEIAEWIKKRLKEVEEEERMLRTLLLLIEEREVSRPDEIVEEIRVGKKRIGRLHKGSNYVRAVPEAPIILVTEVREYLLSLEEELRGSSHNMLEPPRLIVKERPDGTVQEIRFENLQTTLEFIKAKAGLTYAIETSFQLVKNKSREREAEAL